MFDVYNHFRRRVHISKKGIGLSVRIERQNSRGWYFSDMCFGTAMFALFCETFYGASRRHPDLVLYYFPVFALGLTCYVLALLIAVWGAFGVEEIVMEAGSLRWTRTALKWTRTRDIPTADITEIKAITPWHGNNTVELTAAGKSQRIGDKLLRDETVQLAHAYAKRFLKSIVGRLPLAIVRETNEQKNAGHPSG